jgi:hypothetical protein
MVLCLCRASTAHCVDGELITTRCLWPLHGGPRVVSLEADREFGETVILGRQAITLMSVALFVATGLLVDLENIGVRLAWYAFQIGACWVACVDLPGEVGPGPPGGAGVREPRRPTPQSPQSGVAAFRH